MSASANDNNDQVMATVTIKSPPRASQLPIVPAAAVPPAVPSSSPPSTCTPPSSSLSLSASAHPSIVGTPACRSLVVDIGASTIKVGWAGASAPVRIIPNCAVKHVRESRWIVGDAWEPTAEPTSKQWQDPSALQVKRAHERGFITNWELEHQVLSRCFDRRLLDPSSSLPASVTSSSLLSESSLLVTLPPFTPAVLQADFDQHMFETMGVGKMRRITGAPLAARAVVAEAAAARDAAAAKAAQPSSSPSSSPSAAAAAPSTAADPLALSRIAALVIDSGYSFTHIVPVYDGRPVKEAIKRVNVGGKLLTNYLKELISYRAWNMMDESVIINDVKERLCYVSTNFEKELAAAKRSRTVAERLRREYVLPNSSTVLQGYVKEATTPSLPDEQVLTVLNERFCVPECLFRPADVGVDCMGIADAAAAAVAASPKWMQPLLYDNVILCGGNTKLPNYQQRLEKELRTYADVEWRVRVRAGKNPITTIWQGGSLLASDPTAAASIDYVSRAEYQEYGSEALTRRWEGGEEADENGENDSQMTE